MHTAREMLPKHNINNIIIPFKLFRYNVLGASWNTVEHSLWCFRRPPRGSYIMILHRTDVHLSLREFDEFPLKHPMHTAKDNTVRL